MDGHPRQQSSEDLSITRGDGNGSKRKSEDGSSDQTRVKIRNRYTSIACNECKRRKIKCNGETPCQRCGNLSLECLYTPNCCSTGFKDSDEFRQMNAHIQSLQEQVDNLYANVTALYNKQDTSTPQDSEPDGFSRHMSMATSNSQNSFQVHTSPSQSRNKIPRFRGPTSSAFNFDVAKTSLRTMGITATEDEANEGPLMQNGTSLDNSLPNQASLAPMMVQPSKEPLWMLGRDEAIRLCRAFEEEMAMMYPILDMDQTISKANLLFTFIESTKRTGVMERGRLEADAFEDNETNILKMVLATASIVQGDGESELGRALFDSVRGTCEIRLWQPVDLKGLVLIVIVAMYHFHIDEEALAWRIIGIAARMCFEMGLHRRETLTTMFDNEEECSLATRLFWSIYVLDRRWSFGTGMPFAMQENDLDPFLPQPDASSPFLVAMISYGRISSKVWRSVCGFETQGNEFSKENIGYLDYQIQQWQGDIPRSLQFGASDITTDHDPPSRPIRRLQVLLSLRVNHLRIMLYRPILHSATSIMENRNHAQTVVEVAKDTIRVLTRLNQTSDIYRTSQVTFNYFLVSALAALFLAVSHAPIEFSDQVRDEFYMALDLVKGFSTKSYISKRLWKWIKGLREVGPKLGVVSRQPLADVNDPHSSAAVAMAGLAGHPVDERAIFSRTQGPSALGNSPIDAQQISYELTNLFEAAGSYANAAPSNGQSSDGMNWFGVAQGDISSGGETMPGIFGNEDIFARIMRDLF